MATHFKPSFQPRPQFNLVDMIEMVLETAEYFNQPITKSELFDLVNYNDGDLSEALKELEQEGFVIEEDNTLKYIYPHWAKCDHCGEYDNLRYSGYGAKRFCSDACYNNYGGK